MTSRPYIIPAVLLIAVAALAMLPSVPDADAASLAQSASEARICDVQGTGGDSPLLDATVVTTGVVTADFIDTPLGAFFMQHPDCDGDVSTSDGIMVFTYSDTPIDVAVGESVVVTGTVEEYYWMTQISVDNASESGVASVGEAARPQPVELVPPADVASARDVLEAHEAMLVALPPQTVIGATNQYGEPYVVPEASGIERIMRVDGDDGRRLGLLFPGGWRVLDHGDRVDGIVGPLNYTFENYKVMVRDPVTITDSGRLPPTPPQIPAEAVSLATYNLLNLFDPVDDPDKNDTQWTPDEAEYAIMLERRARSIAQFVGSPDLVGVQEVETIRALQDLADEPELQDAGYEPLLVEGPDGRGIDVGFLYRPERLALDSYAQAQKCVPDKPFEDDNLGRCALPGEDDPSGFPLYSRPPLIGRFTVRATGAELIVIVNHFKSKRGGDDVTTPIRTAMAEHNLELVAAEQSRNPDATLVVMGDLNDFPDRPPIETLTNGGLVDLHGPSDPPDGPHAYTYVFNGVSQILDYIMVPQAARDAVVHFGTVHSNVDFGAPPPDAPDHASPRTSDHDAVLMAVVPPPPSHFEIFLPSTLRTADVGGFVESATATATATATAPPAPTGAATSTPGATAEPTAPPPGVPPRSPVRIVDVFYDGEVRRVESDEYVEFENVTADPVDLGGWEIRSSRGPNPNDQVFPFPAGAVIEPGQRCRLYTDQDGDAGTCWFNWEYSRSAIWNNSGDCAELRDPSVRLIDRWCYGDAEPLGTGWPSR